MARNSRRSNGMKKIEPAVKTIQFTLPGDTTYSYIDLSECASIVNRRFYRQGLNWAVAGFTIIASDLDSGRVTINRLPSTWCVSNAWEKMFRAWKRQQDEALEDGTQESVKARYNDFKIYMDQAHFDAGSAANLTPVGSVPLPYLEGEWNYSQVVVPNHPSTGSGNWEPYLQMLGGQPAGTDPASIGLIDAYANSRSVPQSPDPSVPTGVSTGGENVLKRIFDVGGDNDQVLDNVIEKNDELPYDQEVYPGQTGDQSENVGVMQFTNTSIGSMSRIKGGSFPCGLIQIQGSLTQDAVLYVHLVPGSHRGYLCEPMTEM